MGDSDTIDASNFRDLTHEMNNSLAYVVTNLNLLSEELEGSDARLNALVADALEGSERMGELLRRLRRASWGVEIEKNKRPDPAPAEGPATEPARILVVDDESAILTAVQRALRAHEVEVAHNGQEALECLEKPFDLILCDLMMPGMTGIELFARLQNERPKVADRVVFMTAGGFTHEVRQFLFNVRNGVLHKPFDVKTLRWMVDQKLKEARSNL